MFAKNEGLDQKTKDQFAELGMNVNSIEDAQYVIDLLNTMTEKFAFLHFTFQDKIIFEEDLMLKQHLKAKFMMERDYDKLSLANYIIQCYQENQNK